jgi:hypothetical protein
MEVNEDPLISRGWHWTYGWLRMPTLDNAYNGYVYEDGDGSIMVFHQARFKKAVYLECRKDLLTGERYICVSHVPRVCNWKQKRKKWREPK